MEILNAQASKESKKKIDLLRGHSFKVICTSLIKLLDNSKIMFNENRIEQAYVQYMGVVNIFTDELPKLKNFDKRITEYNVLISELNSSYDTIVEIKKRLQEKERTGQMFAPLPQPNSPRALQEQLSTRSVSSVSFTPPPPPRPIPMKTIPPDAVFKYVSRIISGDEQNPPQILLIDIREPNLYHNGHITWKNNSTLNYNYYNGVINIPINLFNEMNMDFNRLIDKAENMEINSNKKALIRNICESDLIIFYDFNSDIIDKELHQIIPNTLFNPNNNMKIKRPPVMLENGYNGWLQFLQNSGKKISDWVEINK